MATKEPENWIIVQGTRYRMPDEFTLGEHRILKHYMGISAFQMADLDLSDPDFLAAVIHICVARAEPRRSRESVERFVDSLKLETDLDVETTPVEEETVDPLSSAASEPSGNGSPTPGTDFSGVSTPAMPTHGSSGTHS